MGFLKTKKQIEEQVEFVPCIKCNGEEITFYNCGYSSFNVGVAKCKCGNEVKVNGIGWNEDDSVIVPYWNEENDPKILKEKYLGQIAEIQKLIDALPQHII